MFQKTEKIKGDETLDEAGKKIGQIAGFGYTKEEMVKVSG